MVKQHWGLQRSPFAAAHISAFCSEAQQESIARIQFLVQEQRRLGLLVGPEGVGKSAVLRFVASDRQRRALPCAIVNAIGLDASEFLGILCQQLDFRLERHANLATMWRRIDDGLTTNQYQQLDTLVLIDDLHDADTDVLIAVTRLTQWQPVGGGRLTIVGSTLPDRLELIPARMRELVDLRMDLEGWQVEDTAEFIRRQLAAAGCQRIVFDHGAIDEIHEASRGVARRICQLADMALIAGAGLQLQRIDGETVMAVQEELGVPVVATF